LIDAGTVFGVSSHVLTEGGDGHGCQEAVEEVGLPAFFVKVE